MTTFDKNPPSSLFWETEFRHVLKCSSRHTDKFSLPIFEFVHSRWIWGRRYWLHIAIENLSVFIVTWNHATNWQSFINKFGIHFVNWKHNPQARFSATFHMGLTIDFKSYISESELTAILPKQVWAEWQKIFFVGQTKKSNATSRQSLLDLQNTMPWKLFY